MRFCRPHTYPHKGENVTHTESQVAKNQGMGSGTGTPKQQISYAPFKEVEKIKQLPGKGICVILSIWENHRAKAALPLLFFGGFK